MGASSSCRWCRSPASHHGRLCTRPTSGARRRAPRTPPSATRRTRDPCRRRCRLPPCGHALDGVGATYCSRCYWRPQRRRDPRPARLRGRPPLRRPTSPHSSKSKNASSAASCRCDERPAIPAMAPTTRTSPARDAPFVGCSFRAVPTVDNSRSRPAATDTPPFEVRQRKLPRASRSCNYRRGDCPVSRAAGAAATPIQRTRERRSTRREPAGTSQPNATSALRRLLPDGPASVAIANPLNREFPPRNAVRGMTKTP